MILSSLDTATQVEGVCESWYKGPRWVHSPFSLCMCIFLLCSGTFVQYYVFFKLMSHQENRKTPFVSSISTLSLRSEMKRAVGKSKSFRHLAHSHSRQLRVKPHSPNLLNPVWLRLPFHTVRHVDRCSVYAFTPSTSCIYRC